MNWFRSKAVEIKPNRVFFVLIILFGTSWTGEVLTIEQRERVYRYAPIIFQNISKKSVRHSWDFITSFDFDGDSIGNNNEQSLRSGEHSMPATVYYAIVETSSHCFITYSFFHPLDWSSLHAIFPYSWHENDMENLQVVIKKGPPDSVELAAVQAHLKTHFHLPEGLDRKPNKIKISQEYAGFITNSFMEPKTHLSVSVEKGGHGIHNLPPGSEIVENSKKGDFTDYQIFMPSPINSPDVFSREKKVYNYQLLPTYDAFWVPYRDKVHLGNGKLLDGSFNYKDELFDLQGIPRHFDSDRFSGPGKYDSGIIPFAFSHSLTANDLGVIFFNPVLKYMGDIQPVQNWSTKYTYHPYLEDQYSCAEED